MTAIRYEDLLDIADVAKDWYAGQGDAVYALVSSVFAGRDVPLHIAEDALNNLESDYSHLKADRPAGWRHEAKRLGTAITDLEFQINATRAHAGMQPNPLAMGGGEKVAIGVGIVAGLAALAYYVGKSIGTSVGTAVGKGATSV